MPENKENETAARKKKNQVVAPEDDKIVRKSGTKANDPAKDEDDSSGDLKPLGNTKP